MKYVSEPEMCVDGELRTGTKFLIYDFTFTDTSGKTHVFKVAEAFYKNGEMYVQELESDEQENETYPGAD